MDFWVFQGLSCLSGSSHLSLPGHSGSSPRLVQIRSSHFHQRYEGCTGDHPVFRDIFHKIPSGKQQPPVTTAGFTARSAWRVQHVSHRRRMCLPPGELLGTEDPESPWSLISPNSANDDANERKSWGIWEESWRRKNHRFFSVPQTSLKYNILPKKDEFPFALEVHTLPQTCDGPKAHTSFQISLSVR